MDTREYIKKVTLTKKDLISAVGSKTSQLNLFIQRHDLDLTDEEIFGGMEDFDWLDGNPANLRIFFEEAVPRLREIGRSDLVADASKRLKRLEDK